MIDSLEASDSRDISFIRYEFQESHCVV